LREAVEPCLLAREMDVARERDAASWFIVLHQEYQAGLVYL
jgi:hypothetical protein